MEPTQTPPASVAPLTASGEVAQTSISAPAPSEPAPLEHHHVSAVLIFCSSIILLFAATSAYLYFKNSQYELALGQISSQVMQLQAQLQQAGEREITIVGPVMNSVYKVDDTAFIFLDTNGKAWVVNHNQSQFEEFSATTGKSQGTDGKMSTTLSDWLKREHKIGQAEDVTGAPGTITIKGILKNDGVVYASGIRVDGQ